MSSAATTRKRKREIEEEVKNFSVERACALNAVRLASHVCRDVQNKLVLGTGGEIKIDKADKSPVTVADFASQAIVNMMLMKEFPSCKIVGEEDAKALREDPALCQKVLDSVLTVDSSATAENVMDAIDYGSYAGGPEGSHWALDPIDGTKGFLRGEQYAVALGLIQDGQVQLGVLGCPNLPTVWAERDTPGAEKGVIMVGVKGEGAFSLTLDPESKETPLQVSQEADSNKAFFTESVEAGHSSHTDSAQISAILGLDDSKSVRMDSQCKYAAIARGDAPIYLRLPTRKGYEERIWDHAAGVAVIEAAGGKVTDVNGKDLDFSIGRTLRDNLGVIATNGFLHEEVLTATKQVLGGSSL